MKNARTVTLVLAASLSLLATAQDQAKKTPPKPAPSASQAVLDSWNEIGRKLIEMAEDFPEDKYDFKAIPLRSSVASEWP